MIGLPRTTSKLLLATVLLLVLALLLAAANAVRHFVQTRDVPDLVEASLLALLAFGMWRLNRFARMACVFVLWFFVLVVPLGIFNPFMASDMRALGRDVDIPRALMIFVPIWVAALAVLHILQRHKAEFGKPDERGRDPA